MNALEWPAGLTDFRLPAKWDGQRVDWHGWHPPIEARTLFLCENNGLRFSDFLQESFFERMIIVVSVRFSSTQLRNRKSRSIFQNVVLKKGCCADAKN